MNGDEKMPLGNLFVKLQCFLQLPLKCVRPMPFDPNSKLPRQMTYDADIYIR